jgi:hypothetical protein
LPRYRLGVLAKKFDIQHGGVPVVLRLIVGIGN